MCDTDPFANVVAKNFDKIKASFAKRANNLGLDFDEDLFMDTFIKCDTTLKNKQFTEQEYIQYFWKAYVNGSKTPPKITTVSLDDPNRGSIVPDLPSPYNPDVDRKYQEICEKLGNKFEEHYIQAFLLHYAEDKSYKELEELGYNFKHNNIFKRMMKYIKNS